MQFTQIRGTLLVNYPPKQPKIKICTQLQPEQNFQSKHQLIGKVHLYTRQSVFAGEIKGHNVNPQLTRNHQSYQMICQALGGQRPKIQIFFNQEDKKLSLSCEIRSGIDVKLFTIALAQLKKEKPMAHMIKSFTEIKHYYEGVSNELNTKRQILAKQRKEINAMEKYIEDKTNSQIQYMKNNFLTIINGVKGKIKKYINTGIQEVQQQVEDEDTKTRTIYKINRQSLKMQNKTNSDSIDGQFISLFQ